MSTLSSIHPVFHCTAVTESTTEIRGRSCRLKVTFAEERETANFFSYLIQKKTVGLEVYGSCDRVNREVTILSSEFSIAYGILRSSNACSHTKRQYVITESVLSEDDNKMTFIFANLQNAKTFASELQKLLSARKIDLSTPLASWSQEQKSVAISPILIAQQVITELCLPPTSPPLSEPL
jgi:hypothetical protein